MSAVRHPHIDGLIERVVATHLDLLSDWVSHIPMVDFNYIFSTNETSTHLKCLINIY
jgi:hypothetical protein